MKKTEYLLEPKKVAKNQYNKEFFGNIGLNMG